MGTGSINNILLIGDKTSEEINVVDMTNPKLTLDGYQIEGNIDKEIYDALVALGWDRDVLGLYVDVNLTYHGSFVDSSNTVGGYKVFQSNASYNVNNAWDTAKITFSGFDTFTLYIRSYAESSYDYILVSTLNNDYLASRATTSAMRSVYSNTEYTKAYTRSKQSATNYEEVVFDNLDPNQEYYFYIIYQKDSSTNSNDDRGYFYIPYNITIV